MDRLGQTLGARIPSRSRHVRHDAVAMETAVAALNIQQLWASGGRTREPILMKFCTQRQIKTIMTVTWSNIKIQNGGRPPSWKILKIRLPIDRLGRKLDNRIPSRSRHVRYDTLNIQQLLSSGGQTREPILMKFGTQQQINTSLTVTWSNIKMFKIQDGGRPPC